MSPFQVTYIFLCELVRRQVDGAVRPPANLILDSILVDLVV